MRAKFTFFLSILVVLALSWVAPGPLFLTECPADEELVVAGTGDSQSILRILAQHFMQTGSHCVVKIPDSIGSGGGIKDVLSNRHELARTARPLKPEEQDGTLVEYPFAISPVVFVIHPSVTGITNLTNRQIIDIYTGRTHSWGQLGGPAVPIYPVDREPCDSSRTILENHMQGFREAKSVAKIFYTTPEAVAAIREHRYTIGFLPLGLALESNLHVVAIDGFAPISRDIKTGTYPYIATYALVARKPVSRRATEFIDFIYSPDAAAIMTKHGLIPLGRTH